MKIAKLKQSDDSLGSKIIGVLVAYAKSQLILIASITLLTWIILTWLGVRYAVLLAFAAGACSVVPFFGMSMVAIVASLVAVFDGLRFLPDQHPVLEGVIVLIIFFLLNQVSDLFLAPLLTAKITRIHPLIVFLAVAAGTALLGIPGTFLAVPVLLVGKTVLDHIAARK